MDRRSNPLGSEERGVIFAGHERGRSQRAIGRLPGRPASTIGRALARGRRADGRYGPQAARRAHDTRRARCGRRRKLAEGSALYASSMTTLSFGAGRLSRSRTDCGA